MRPATLDRVENGGSGSDINRRERKAKGSPNSNNQALLQPVTIKSAGVLEAVKARPGSIGVRFYGGAPAGLDSLCAAPASEICGRGGRKPAARSNKRKRPSKQVSK